MKVDKPLFIMIKFRKFEGWRIEYEMNFFRTYLNEIERALQEKYAKLKQEWEVSEKEEDSSEHQDYLTECYDELQQHFGIFYSSFVITIFSFIEHELNRICSIPPTKDKPKIVLRDIHGKGIKRAKTFMEKVCDFDLPKEDLWKELEKINEIRNCLVHSGGELNDSNKDLINHIEKSGKIKIEENRITKIKRISITKNYCSFVIEIIEKYLLILIDKNVESRWEAKSGA